jgi:hypothetical protein
MKTYTSWILIGVAVVLIIGGMVWYASRPGQYDRFATCIKDSGAKFYGAWWCPHCTEQKSLFGKSAKNLPYIECSNLDKTQNQLCNDAKITGYPTWEFSNGERTGQLSLPQLASKTACPLLKDKDTN